MFLNNSIQYNILSVYKELQHFTTTIHKGVSEGNYASFNLGLTSGDKLENVLENRRRLCTDLDIPINKLFIPIQNHDDKVLTIDHDLLALSEVDQQEMLQNTDALITNQKNICIGITTADCVPILLYDPINKVFAAIHAGWRGTVRKIVSKTISIMKQKFNCNSENILSGIGPCICQDCFEVDENVAETFIKAGFELENISLKSHQSKKYYIDLRKANEYLLKKSGCLSHNIEIINLCTVSNPNILFSARRQTIYSGRMLTGGILR